MNYLTNLLKTIYFVMSDIKKSINNLLKEQIKNLELLNSLTDIYTESKDFQNLYEQERNLLFRLKAAQNEYLKTIDKYIKY